MATAENQSVFQRLGGGPAVKAVIDDFYTRIMDDKGLEKFFAGVEMSTLRKHQFMFMKTIFTKIPDNADVMILNKHKRLFPMGLNEKHFDMVAGHLVASMNAHSVPDNLIDEVVAIIGPLRAVFEKGAQDCAN